MISSRKKKHPEREREILSYTPGESWCWTSNATSGGAGSATSDFSGNGRSETGFSTSNERSGSGGSPTSCFSAMGRSETGKTPKDWEKKRRKAKPIRTNETDILIQMWLCLWRAHGFQSNLFSFTIFSLRESRSSSSRSLRKSPPKHNSFLPHTTLTLSSPKLHTLLLLCRVVGIVQLVIPRERKRKRHEEREKMAYERERRKDGKAMAFVCILFSGRLVFTLICVN